VILQRLVGRLRERVWDFRLRLYRQHIRQLCDRGMKIGRNVVVMDAVRFDHAYPWLIEIEDDCRISHGVRILAHDASSHKDLGVTRLGRVRILHDTFIGERAIILPGVTIGPRAMVAAGSVVSRDFGEGVLVAGNPARIYGQYDEYLARTRDACSSARVVDLADIDSGRESPEDILAAMDRAQAVFVKGAPPGARSDLTAQSTEAFERNFGQMNR
jgi:acetyltransferase-like isoleucine patch superfamily enzyme